MVWEAPQIAVIAAGRAYRAVAPELVCWAGVAFIFSGECVVVGNSAEKSRRTTKYISPTDGRLDLAGELPLDKGDVNAAFPEETDARHAEPTSQRADLQTLVEAAPWCPP